MYYALTCLTTRSAHLSVARTKSSCMTIQAACYWIYMRFGIQIQFLY